LNKGTTFFLLDAFYFTCIWKILLLFDKNNTSFFIATGNFIIGPSEADLENKKGEQITRIVWFQFYKNQ
jgi:hypothetical protein